MKLFKEILVIIGVLTIGFLLYTILFTTITITNTNNDKSFIKKPLVTFQNENPIGTILEGTSKENKDYTASSELTKQLISQTVSIVMVDNGIGSCSGTIIAENEKNHYVLTAKHCIGINEEMYVEHNKVLYITTSIADDIALIIVDGKIPNKTVAKLAEQSANLGDTVHHVAYPSGIIYKRSGKVTRITNDWVWFNFKAIGGCSGGGIFNKKGELVSVLWGGFRYPKKDAPIKSVAEPLKDIKIFLSTITGNKL